MIHLLNNNFGVPYNVVQGIGHEQMDQQRNKQQQQLGNLQWNGDKNKQMVKYIDNRSLKRQDSIMHMMNYRQYLNEKLAQIQYEKEKKYQAYLHQKREEIKQRIEQEREREKQNHEKQLRRNFKQRSKLLQRLYYEHLLHQGHDNDDENEKRLEFTSKKL